MPGLFRRNRHRQQVAEWAFDAVKQLYPFLRISLPFAVLAHASAQTIDPTPVFNTSEPMSTTSTNHHTAESEASLSGELIGGGIAFILLIICAYSGWKYYAEHNKKHKALQDGHIQGSDECAAHDSCDEEKPLASGYTSSARPAYV